MNDCSICKNYEPVTAKTLGQAQGGRGLTNGDRIRAMTDEELMEWMADHVDCGEGCPAFHICRRTPMEGMNCEGWLLQWLKMEDEG